MVGFALSAGLSQQELCKWILSVLGLGSQQELQQRYEMSHPSLCNRESLESFRLLGMALTSFAAAALKCAVVFGFQLSSLRQVCTVLMYSAHASHVFCVLESPGL